MGRFASRCNSKRHDRSIARGNRCPACGRSGQEPAERARAILRKQSQARIAARPGAAERERQKIARGILERACADRLRAAGEGIDASKTSIIESPAAYNA